MKLEMKITLLILLNSPEGESGRNFEPTILYGNSIHMKQIFNYELQCNSKICLNSLFLHSLPIKHLNGEINIIFLRDCFEIVLDCI
jgi:hypothetical protein